MGGDGIFADGLRVGSFAEVLKGYGNTLDQGEFWRYMVRLNP